MNNIVVFGLIFAITGLLIEIAVLPLILKKIGPNKYYGIRLPGYEKYPQEYWKETNCEGGKILMGLGFNISMMGAFVALAVWQELITADVMQKYLWIVPVIVIANVVFTIIKVVKIDKKLREKYNGG